MEDGEQVIVTRHGKPVAQIAPAARAPPNPVGCDAQPGHTAAGLGRTDHRGGIARRPSLSEYLLDTNFALLGVSEPDRLPATVRQTVESGQVHLSVICYWEVMLKSIKGALDVGDPRQWWAEALDVFGARALPVRPDHVAVLHELPPIHKDPFDRMMIAQAVAADLHNPLQRTAGYQASVTVPGAKRFTGVLLPSALRDLAHRAGALVPVHGPVRLCGTAVSLAGRRQV